MPLTIVLGYDGSDCAKLALKRTTDLVGLIPDAIVVVVSAYEFSIGYVPVGMTDSPLMMSAEYDEHVALVQGVSRSHVDEAAAELRAAGITTDTLLVEGRPVDALLEAAEQRGAALIVVGSHGESAVSAAFLGSAALKLLHHSEIPVLVVPRRRRK